MGGLGSIPLGCKPAMVLAQDVADPAHDLDVEIALADLVPCRSYGARTAGTRETF